MNKNLFSLVFTIFLDFLSFGIVLPILAPLLLDPARGILPPDVSYSARAMTLGIVISAFPIAQFFGAPILGTLSDRYGRKIILLVSIGGTAISLVLSALGVHAGLIWLMLVARIVNGITGGNVSTAQSAIADMSDSGSRARNFGLIGMAFGLGFVLGPFVGGKLADHNLVSWFDYATPYWFAALLSTVNVLLIWRWFDETHHVRSAAAQISFMTGIRNLKRVFSQKKIRIMFSVVFFAVFGFTFFTQFFQVYLIAQFKLNQVQIGEMYAYIGLWIAFTQGGLTRILSRRFDSPQLIRVSLLSLSAGLLGLLLPGEVAWLRAFIPIVSISQGITMPNITAMISNSAGMESQGEILGINQSVQSVAYAIPPVVAGMVTSLDDRLPIILASTFTFLAWLLYIVFYKRESTARVQ